MTASMKGREKGEGQRRREKGKLEEKGDNEGKGSDETPRRARVVHLHKILFSTGCADVGRMRIAMGCQRVGEHRRCACRHIMSGYKQQGRCRDSREDAK